MVKILSLDDYVNSFVRAFSDEYEVVKAFSLEEAKEKMGSTIWLYWFYFFMSCELLWHWCLYIVEAGSKIFLGDSKVRRSYIGI